MPVVSIWEHAHASLARDMNNAPHIAQDRAVSDDTFGGARVDDQVKIVHEIEAGNTGSTPGANRLIGDLTIADRARNVGAVIRNTENALRAVDPEMAGKLLSEPYFPHGGAWDLPRSRKAPTRRGVIRRSPVTAAAHPARTSFQRGAFTTRSLKAKRRDCRWIQTGRRAARWRCSKQRSAATLRWPIG